jgi:hypothetical protein
MTDQPSPQARRAAELISDLAASLSLSCDCPRPDGIAEIIECETGVGILERALREIHEKALNTSRVTDAMNFVFEAERITKEACAFLARQNPQ